MKLHIIIGANYGDEGKGMATDWLCSKCEKPIVVLANGGSQRGHTVENDIGKYVFHHFGSGALRGVPTLFASSFIVNPMQFIKEYNELKTLTGTKPAAYMSNDCAMQLPSDIALNWHLEKCRGENRHGSTGCGIWESVLRAKEYGKITLRNFAELSYPKQVAIIKDAAIAARVRCKEEGVTSYIDIMDLFTSAGFISHFIADAIDMNNICKRTRPPSKCSFTDIIVENGQGLMLDQYYMAHDICHTTPSFTGSIGVAKALSSQSVYGIGPVAALSEINLHYVSRTYITRHGCGELYGEDNGIWFPDRTNVKNDWQGELRFAELNCKNLLSRINNDMHMAEEFMPRGIPVKKNLIFTHCNEIKFPNFNFMRNLPGLTVCKSDHSKSDSIQYIA